MSAVLMLGDVSSERLVDTLEFGASEMFFFLRFITQHGTIFKK